MKRYVLTGTPGSGKTAILRWLESEGEAVIEEAATDVIALRQARGEPEPWTGEGFVAAVTDLQRRRQLRAAAWTEPVQFYDRSPICTYTLARFLGHPIPPVLEEETRRIVAEGIYEKRVFFVRNIGFTTSTSARRISYEDSLAFERLHWETYRDFGFECVPVAPGPLPDRVAAIRRGIREARRGGVPSS